MIFNEGSKSIGIEFCEYQGDGVLSHVVVC